MKKSLRCSKVTGYSKSYIIKKYFWNGNRIYIPFKGYRSSKTKKEFNIANFTDFYFKNRYVIKN